jgi:hypothetical protein
MELLELIMLEKDKIQKQLFCILKEEVGVVKRIYLPLYNLAIKEVKPIMVAQNFTLQL